MSYDNWKLRAPEDEPGYALNNPPEQPEDEDRFQCPSCDSWMVDGDPANVRLGSQLICEDCAKKHPVIVGELAAQLSADEIRDQFERRDR